ncbi:MAG: glucose-6-phosphate isomerase [Acholeplasmataceae bacterium]|nr:glucose-6-phosphate isomerase [Acholeplasmataceae bacterium]
MRKVLELKLDSMSHFLSKTDFETIRKEVEEAKRTLLNGSGPGQEFRGWLDLPVTFDEDELNRILTCAKKIRSMANVLVVIGIGGSYLGTRAAVEALRPYFSSRKRMEIIYAGQTLSSQYLSELLFYLKNKEFAINVISKSGTTIEPAIAFRALNNLLKAKYGDEASKRVFVTSDRKKGALKKLANQQQYESFVIPDDIGGRFSVLTPVGLLPIAAMGISIKRLLAGAKAARNHYLNASYWKNDAMLYAAARNLLYRKEIPCEMLVNYEPKLNQLAEWWKQLFAESEGKDGKGLFVASASFSTDLHSLGQYIQEGRRLLFETVIQINEPQKDVLIEKEPSDFDGLNYLAGKTLDVVNKRAFEGTLMAHISGQVPNLILNLDKLDPYSLGYLFYFFELAVGISGYILGINPFNQPGVEQYKKNMFRLLDKPGIQ